MSSSISKLRTVRFNVEIKRSFAERLFITRIQFHGHHIRPCLCLREPRCGFPSRLSTEPCYSLNFWRKRALWSSPASPFHFQGSELFGFCRSREQWGQARHRCGHVRHQVPRAITLAPLSIYRVLCVMCYALDGGKSTLIQRSPMQLAYVPGRSFHGKTSRACPEPNCPSTLAHLGRAR